MAIAIDNDTSRWYGCAAISFYIAPSSLKLSASSLFVVAHKGEEKTSCFRLF